MSGEKNKIKFLQIEIFVFGLSLINHNHVIKDKIQGDVKVNANEIDDCI